MKRQYKGLTYKLINAFLGRVPHRVGAASRLRLAQQPLHRQVGQARAVHHGRKLQQGLLSLFIWF